MDKRRLMKVLIVCVVLILVLAIVYSGLRILESTIFFRIEDQLQTESKIIIRDGVKYYPRKDITVIMVLGINRTGKVEPTEFNHGGAADMVALLILDEKQQVCNVLNLNRDMMVDMPVLNQHGKPVGVNKAQLAYSHTYGDGMKESCRNVRTTVSNLLYGVQIDYFMALNMDTVPILNDSVGGVKVNVMDDFSQVDPSIPKGEVLLMGQQALNFVQSRWYVGDELNLSRMERQREYMRNFAPAVKAKIQEDAAYAVDTYGKIQDLIVTDCVVDNFARLATEYSSYPMGQILTVPGKNVMGQTYYEFYPDEKALDDMIIKLFYEPKN